MPCMPRRRDDSHDVLEHYPLAEERERLDTPIGQVELERTREIILGHLPSPPAVVADIGGGPGRYALWLAETGYRVVHRDLVPQHVEQLAAEAGQKGLDMSTAVADARKRVSRKPPARRSPTRWASPPRASSFRW